MLIKEFCAENFTNIPTAIHNGAKRIELCDNLTVGGTTVSPGVMSETYDYCHEKGITVMSIIRPRGGNFVYNDTELKIMAEDLTTAKERGTDGIVIGCLTEDNWIDEEAMLEFIKLSDGLQLTFHMAFDELSVDDQFKAIDWLAKYGVQRILTHGGKAGTPIMDNIDHLTKLVDYSDGRIIILPGGGINHENCEAVATALNVTEIHGTKIVPLDI